MCAVKVTSTSAYPKDVSPSICGAPDQGAAKFSVANRKTLEFQNQGRSNAHKKAPDSSKKSEKKPSKDEFDEKNAVKSRRALLNLELPPVATSTSHGPPSRRAGVGRKTKTRKTHALSEENPEEATGKGARLESKAVSDSA